MEFSSGQNLAKNIEIPNFQPYEYVAGQNRTKYGKIVNLPPLCDISRSEC